MQKARESELFAMISVPLQERMIYPSGMIYASRMIYACGVLWNGYYIILRRRSNISYLREQIYHTRASEYIIKRRVQMYVLFAMISVSPIPQNLLRSFQGPLGAQERMIYASRMISAARMIYACGVLTGSPKRFLLYSLKELCAKTQK